MIIFFKKKNLRQWQIKSISIPPWPGSWTLLSLITFFYKLFLFNYMIKLYAHKTKHEPKNRQLFETIITL